MKSIPDKKRYYRAHLARDPRFDGKFFVAVKTTKIYCRPICPAKKARLENIEFFMHAVQAEEAGYRPCIRCRPETAPGSSAWLGVSAIVQRAIRLMDRLAMDELSINTLAEKLCIGERWLRELFQKEIGASPQSILLGKKLDIARNLLDESSLPITEIAFSSGFQSIRRFNDAFKLRFQKSPRAFRADPHLKDRQGQWRFQLSYRPPYAWSEMLQFLEGRAIPGVELIADQTYQRLVTDGDIRGWFKVSPGADNKIQVEWKLDKPANIMEFSTRIKNIFDLDADPMAIETSLGEDEVLKPFLKQFSGLRIPGGWDGFELAVRAVVGQKISVKAARTILGRIVEMGGETQTLDASLPLLRYFPSPENMLAADLSNIGLPATRVETLKSLARAIADKALILDGTADYHETCQKLLAIKGIGPWTVQYIAMRALRNPDSFPEKDLEIQKKMTRLQLHPEKWSPWRAYGAILLWNIKLEAK